MCIMCVNGMGGAYNNNLLTAENQTNPLVRRFKHFSIPSTFRFILALSLILLNASPRSRSPSPTIFFLARSPYVIRPQKHKIKK